MKKIGIQFYYGWIIVFIGALSIFFSGPGQTYSVSIFIDFYIEEFGWSRSQISSFYSIATLISGFFMPVVGNLIDKKGQRKATITVALLFGLTLIWMSMIQAPWMILIGFLFIRMFGQGSLTLIPNVLIPQWFVSKRGRALSFISYGGVMGAAFIPPLNNYLIQNYSLSIAWLFWAAMMFFILLPIAFFFMKNRPEDIGLLPDGAEKLSELNKSKAKPASEAVSWTLQEAKQTRSFWLMLFVSAVPSLLNTAITFHIVSIIGEKGYGATFAAFLLSTIAITQMVLTVFAGYTVERVPVHIVKGFNYILYAGVIFLLIFANNDIYLIGFAILQGFFMAFDTVSTGVLWPNYFGRMHLGKIRGLTMAAMVIGSALGPFPYGVAYDYLGSYNQILLVSIALPVFASIASFLSPAPVHKSME
ncbi:MFS transporter [Lacticigenium naphthae]|uniref:MFS transporter n=1 Tax=Lacticigenium naphthae TaxID=515351 RepID=UPI0003F8E09A|nr:MFS transporter [Lacticigenium naphthae]